MANYVSWIRSKVGHENMKKTALAMLSIVVFLIGCSSQPENKVNSEMIQNSESSMEQSESQSEISSAPETEKAATKWEDIWYATREYPSKAEETEFSKLSAEEKTDVLNPPQDLLDEMTTRELAELTLRYPLFSVMPWYDDTQKDIQLSIYAGYSKIYEEILKRDDHVEAILQAYRNLELNRNASETEMLTDESWQAEYFVENFVLANGNNFTDKQRSDYLEIVQERTETYYSKIDGCKLGRISFDTAKNPYRKYYFYNVELPNRNGGGLMSTPYIEYSDFLHGMTSAVLYDESEELKIWDIVKDNKLECTMLDLDGDGVDEMLIQAVDSPGTYNGVFHCEDGRVICWNHDANEEACRDYPLEDGTMVRQYDTNGSTIYTIFKYLPNGKIKEINKLFARQELMPEDSTEPCPYYSLDGREITKEEFEEALESMVNSVVLAKDAWSALSVS